MSWAEEQQAFWRLITKPQDLRDSAESITRMLAPHSQLSQVEALAVYNNAYHQRMIQISAELYPITYHTLGEAVYSRLWLDYMAVHPPRPGPMGLLGEYLPDFVRNHPQFGKLPALVSIVELESLLIRLFDVADERACTLAQLQSLPPAEWAQTRWVAKSDWALLHSHFDLETYWARMQTWLASAHAIPGSADFGVEPLADPAGTTYLVRRVNHRMEFRAINQSLAIFLSGILQGETFAVLCERLADAFPQQDTAALSLGLLLRSIELALIKA